MGGTRQNTMGPAPRVPGRRDFLRSAVLGAVSLPALGGAPDSWSEEEFEIVRREIPFGPHPRNPRPVRAALISDIHVGLFMTRDDLEVYVRVINDFMPDIVLLPGDFVSNLTAEIFPACEALERITATHGVYACLGNHEFYTDPDLITRELRRAGVNVLRDEHRILEIAGEKIAIAGVDDIRGDVSLTERLTHACEGLETAIPSILLCHKPYDFDEVPQFGIDLVVSGHTHGGQIVLAEIFDVTLTPASLISRYVRGLYTCAGSSMYVTRGIGTVGLPIRLNCPPEVTLLTLR